MDHATKGQLMQQIREIARLKEALAAERIAGRSIGFVPTMGALHAGHMALVEAAQVACDVVVVSIFVNPTQFDRKNDFANYPRDEKSDARTASGAGVDVLFTPSAEEMYPDGYRTYIQVEDLSATLCGSVRPGHFRGVVTVVAKLLEIVRPDRAYFGEKDYQQLVLIRRMVEDLDMGVEIVGIPTVRDADGLATSSRNVLLGPTERAAAAVIPHALFMAKDMVRKENATPKDVIRSIEGIVGEEPLVRMEYLSVVDPETLRDVKRIGDKALIAVAAYVGDVRLIDNVMVGPGA